MRMYAYIYIYVYIYICIYHIYIHNMHICTYAHMHISGNGILGKFGMSLDNFKADKDPSTGSYNISFQQ